MKTPPAGASGRERPRTDRSTVDVAAGAGAEAGTEAGPGPGVAAVSADATLHARARTTVIGMADGMTFIGPPQAPRRSRARVFCRASLIRLLSQPRSLAVSSSSPFVQAAMMPERPR